MYMDTEYTDTLIALGDEIARKMHSLSNIKTHLDNLFPSVKNELLTFYKMKTTTDLATFLEQTRKSHV